jgi:hypothetical protein
MLKRCTTQGILWTLAVLVALAMLSLSFASPVCTTERIRSTPTMYA